MENWVGVGGSMGRVWGDMYTQSGGYGGASGNGKGTVGFGMHQCDN